MKRIQLVNWLSCCGAELFHDVLIVFAHLEDVNTSQKHPSLNRNPLCCGGTPSFRTAPSELNQLRSSNSHPQSTCSARRADARAPRHGQDHDGARVRRCDFGDVPEAGPGASTGAQRRVGVGGGSAIEWILP